MTATLTATGLAAGHGHRTLFDGLNLIVAPGDVIGLVGPNGAGKTTLLRVLAGLDIPAAGTVGLSPAGASIGYLAQERDRGAETIIEQLRRRTGVSAATTRLDAATTDLAAGVAGADDRYGDAFEAWLDLGGADLDERAAIALTDVGLGSLADGADRTALATLSGGQAARVGLAALLLARFDMFLLDEPTNDLDLAGLDRLETFVAGLRAGCVVVSHDREFLARCATSIVEIDAAQGEIHRYGGGYDSYLAEREVRRRKARADYDEYADTLDALGDRARMQRGWSDKGVRNALRKAPDNDKILRKARAESSEKQAAKARQTERLIERLPEVSEPRKEWQLQYQIAAAPRGSAVAVSARGVRVARPGFTLGPIDVDVAAGDRIGITGPNGAGKSTLLAALLGRITPDQGTANLGHSVAVGEVDQAREVLASDPTTPLLARMEEMLPDQVPGDLRTLLAKFGLGADHVHRPMATLSPGERTRAALALLQARGVNLLVLDEPTNHLDLPAIEQLESALDTYDATVLLVSHDRRMLERVRLTRRWHLDAGRLSEL